MSTIRVKNKYQIVIPKGVREAVGVEVGDLFDVKAGKHGQITLTPQLLIDRRLAASLKDFEEGRSYGPFDSVDELVASLEKEGKKLR